MFCCVWELGSCPLCQHSVASLSLARQFADKIASSCFKSRPMASLRVSSNVSSVRRISSTVRVSAPARSVVVRAVATKFKVEIEHQGTLHTLEVPEGETILSVALDKGGWPQIAVTHASACGCHTLALVLLPQASICPMTASWASA